MPRIPVTVVFAVLALAAGCHVDAVDVTESTAEATTTTTTPTTRRCNYHIDVTIPPVDQVFRGADVLVKARVLGFPVVNEWTVEVEIEVEELLVAGDSTPAVEFGPLRVGAYDDPCGARTGLRLTGGQPVLIVLNWLGPDDTTFDSPWYAHRVLSVADDGAVSFLDTGWNLNQRIDQILDEPTVAAVISAVSRAND